jgi:hypothetical protein
MMFFGGFRISMTKRKSDTVEMRVKLMEQWCFFKLLKSVYLKGRFLMSDNELVIYYYITDSNLLIRDSIATEF